MFATPGFDYWRRIGKSDPVAVSIADRHYSRRKPGSPQFMPPGQTVVLLAKDSLALFGWWRPNPSADISAINGLDGWTCTIFRNESAVLSSSLILDAEKFLTVFGLDCGSDGLLTYVWPQRISSCNPGCCFQKAGWKKRGLSADGKKILFHKLAIS